MNFKSLLCKILKWEKIENKKKELLQMEKLKKIENLSRKFLKT